MKRFRLNKEDLYDDGVKLLAKLAIKRTSKKDDFFLLIVGLTGTGKSTLGLHLYSEYSPNPSIDYVALNREEFVEALDKANKNKGRKFLDYDEANVMSSDAMTKWNKALVKLYMRIRSKSIFHVWCNPSPRIDRLLIEEKINGVIYVYTKKSPRKYYYLSRQRIISMLDDTKSDKLTLRLLQNSAKKYAVFQGAFRKYEGALADDYERKKEMAGDTAIEEFKEEFGKDARLPIRVIAKELDIGERTLRLRVNNWEKKGVITLGKDYVRDGLGHAKILPEGKEVIRMLLLEENSASF